MSDTPTGVPKIGERQGEFTIYFEDSKSRRQPINMFRVASQGMYYDHYHHYGGRHFELSLS